MERLLVGVALVVSALLATSCNHPESAVLPDQSVSTPREQQKPRTAVSDPTAGGSVDGQTSSSNSPRLASAIGATSSSSLVLFRQRILPILNAQRPSSCSECHLSGVDLKNYIQPDQEKTFAALVAAGLIDVTNPDESKILTFISRKPEKPSLITEEVRREELDAFRNWIHAAVNDPTLLAAESKNVIGPTLPVEVIRHARRDRVLASFIDNIWSEVGRCSSCHSPDQNQKQVREYGEQVSWITLRDPQATLDYMIEAELIDVESPAESLLLQKPTLQVEHGGGQKMMIGDRTYRQFRRFIDDYAAMVSGKYQSVDELPQPSTEVSVATSMSDGIWLKLEGVPAHYDKMLLQVDLYRREGQDWSETRCATADRAVAGSQQLWQQTLSLTASRGSERADELRRNTNLPPGEYLVKIYIDADSKLRKDSLTGLGQDDFVGEVVVNSRWPTGYGRMTVARFPKP